MLTDYYLEQMGLKRWKVRPEVSQNKAELIKLYPSDTSSLKLMLVADTCSSEQVFNQKELTLLNNIFRSIGLSNQHVYFANNTPMDARSYLEEQITAIKPPIIVALGETSGQLLAQTEDSLHGMRQKRYADKNGIPVFVSYHPAYLLKNPLCKKQAFADWQYIFSQL